MAAKCPACNKDINEDSDGNIYSNERTWIYKCPTCGLFFKVIVEDDVWTAVNFWINKTKMME